MSKRRRPKLVTRSGPYGEDRGGRWSSPWVIRAVAIVAAAIVVVAIVYAAMHGVLFATNSR